MRWVGLILTLGWCSAPALAQPTLPTRLEQLSPVDRSKPDFYGAIAGPRESVKIEWQLSAKMVELGETVLLTLIVRNAVNPDELIAPALGKSEWFKEFFSAVELLADLKPDPTAREVRFRYSLRPRNDGPITVEPPVYRYFRPNLPPGRQFQTAFVEPLNLIVTRTPVPLIAPPGFLALAAGSYSASAGVPVWYWAALGLSVPLLIAVWVMVWRRWFPDSARLAYLRRNRAVRRALNRLRLAAKARDPSAETAAVFREYLFARHGLPVLTATPGEVADALAERGFPPERTAAAEALLHRCDEERFAPTPRNATSTQLARQLIETWEELPASAQAR